MNNYDETEQTSASTVKLLDPLINLSSKWLNILLHLSAYSCIFGQNLSHQRRPYIKSLKWKRKYYLIGMRMFDLE